MVKHKGEIKYFKNITICWSILALVLFFFVNYHSFLFSME